MKDKLIFLLSQPRSGSSFLQIQLSYHNSIYSPPESSFLLKYIYDFNPYDNVAFDTNYATHSWDELLSNETSELHKNEFRKFIFTFYENIIKSDNKYFLDKSPRYYHIAKNLLHFFPDSKFIVLLRNPLAVLNSLLNYHYNNSYKKELSNYTCHDLFNSLKIFNSLWIDQKINNNILFIKYEDIILNQKESLNSIFNFLSLDPYETHDEIEKCFLSSAFVDPNAIQYLKPQSHFVDRWFDQITTIQKKNIFLFYINFLRQLKIITDNYDINHFSSLLIKKRVKYTPYMMRTKKLFKNSFQFFN